MAHPEQDRINSMVKELGLEALNLVLQNPHVQEALESLAIIVIGRNRMDLGDEGDDPFYEATKTNILYRVLSETARSLYNPTPNPHWGNHD